MRTANPELNKRMRKASSMIALGTRRDNKEMLEAGRKLSAEAHIENQILLGRELLDKEQILALTRLLYGNESDLYPVRIVQGSDIPFADDEDGIEEEEPAGL